MKKLILSSLLSVVFSSLSFAETTCNIAEAKQALVSARASLKQVKSLSDKNEIVNGLEFARLQMCTSVKACEGRKSTLNGVMNYPCDQKIGYESYSARDLSHDLRVATRRMIKEAFSTLTSTQCYWNISSGHFSISNEKAGLSLSHCKKIIQAELNEVSSYDGASSASIKFNDENGVTVSEEMKVNLKP